MRQIYLDYAATTPLHPEVEAQMRPYTLETFGNPSSTHGYGRKAREAVEKAREQIAKAIDCLPSEVIFTSGGTEADNSAIVGSILAKRDQGRHVVTTAIEHHAVLSACEFIEELGFEVTYVKPNAQGTIEVKQFMDAIRPDTIVASCMWVNNETGAVQPVLDIANACSKLGVVFHTDAVQAAGILPLELSSTSISLLSITAHKFYGPKGVGALIARGKTPLTPYFHGGSQERGRRAGTENVPAIVGFGAAIERVSKDRERIVKHLHSVKQLFVERIKSEIQGTSLLAAEHSVPSIASLLFPNIKNEWLLMNLDLQGIAASSGSACTAGSLLPSHVLLAMGMSVEQVKNTVRFSFSEQTTVEEVSYAADQVIAIVNRLQKT